MTGYVYCIGQRGRMVKVGYSADPRARLVKLRADNPDQIDLLGVIAGDEATEAQMHLDLAMYRVRGEWFSDVCEAVSKRFGPMPAPVVHVVDLRSWLKANGISAAQLADHIGISALRLSNMMTGRHRPNAEAMWAIECATGGAITMQHWVRDVPRVALMHVEMPA